MRRGQIIKKLLLLRLLRRLPLSRLPLKKLMTLRLFPLIPLGPLALLIGSIVTSIRALGRVKRLERRVAGQAS